MRQDFKNTDMESDRGFTVLFAVLLSSLLLSVGVSMFNLLLKELLLASAGRESQTAFYAADTGVECAIYWDQFADSFATSTTDTVECNRDATNGNNAWLVGGSPESRFIMTFLPSKSCSVVTVRKSPSGGTTITSSGYNLGGALSGGVGICESVDPRRVERTLRASY